MSNVILSRPVRATSPEVPDAKWITAAVVLAVWFVLVVVVSAAGLIVAPPGAPPLPLLTAFAAPLVAFFAGIWLSRPFREFVLAADLRLMTAIQAWRFAGLGFLALYAHGVLPGTFALPAGFGDMAIGITAPWILVALIRRPDFAASRTFAVWNVLGLLDLAVAMSTGALDSALATGAVGEVTTGPMATLPLVLIPAYFVPILIMLHVSALVQGRRLARERA